MTSSSPHIEVTSYDDLSPPSPIPSRVATTEQEEEENRANPSYQHLNDAPTTSHLHTHYRSDSDFSDRYFTASSGDELYDDDDDDDDGQLCINLDLNEKSLTGMHIDLQTLSAYSSMLTRYNPIIQSDELGNPVFVAPPPPPYEDWSSTCEDDDSCDDDDALTSSPETSSAGEISDVRTETEIAEEDFASALHELDEVIETGGADSANGSGIFSDALTELTDVMERMANFINDPKSPPQQQT